MRELILEGPLLRKRRVKKLILIGVDACLITVSYLLAVLFRYYMEGSPVNETVAILGNFKWGFILSLGILLLSQWMMKQYQSIWTLARIEDFTQPSRIIKYEKLKRVNLSIKKNTWI